MFTGIISHIFKIEIVESTVILHGGVNFCQLIKIGDSVSVNGICLTVIKIDLDKCYFHITEETISKTNISDFSERLANVELAVKYGEHLGGHLILGHIHTTGLVLSLEENGNLWISIPSSNSVIYKGSIAINGVSLTIAEICENKIRIALIPETIKRTAVLKEGDRVNIEFDSCSIPKKDPMRIAIDEGEKGKSSAPPNPWVGCVIIKNGKEIGRGYHQKVGEPHAEINAINNATESVENSTLYTTLEPCCYFPGKRTGACVDRIIKEKISKVIIGVKDPNPSVCGKGVTILKEAGIIVLFQEDLDKTIYDEVCHSLREYIHFRKTGLPYITAKIALTVDNCYRHDFYKWITHAGSREELYKIWTGSQAIILGPNTVQIDNPELTINDSNSLLLDNRENVYNFNFNFNFNFKKIIIDGDCLTRLDSKILVDKNTYVVTSNPIKWKGVTDRLIEVKSTYDMESVIRNIHEKFNGSIINCLVEGGGIIHKSLFQENLVDELIIFRSPKIYGKEGYVWNIPPVKLHLHETKILSYNGENNIMERYKIEKNKIIENISPKIEFDSVEHAIEVFAKGGFVLVMDDEGRENEGDLIVSAKTMTESQMTEMINMTTGIICTPIEKSRAKQLNFPLMVENNTDTHQTAFTVSIDYKGTGTGVSSSDRLLTVKALADENNGPNDFRRPGHIFPLVSRSSLNERKGHTEAAIALCKLSNIYPRVAVIGELINKDGTMKRRDDCFIYARSNNIPIITVEQLSKIDTSPKILAECDLHTRYGNNCWRFLCFESGKADMPHKVLIYGELKDVIPVRIHSECFTGDVLKSMHCDCGEQLDISMQKIVENGYGILIFPSSHEGRGIGIVEKVKAYNLQSKGSNTFEANQKLGHSLDARTYEDINHILESLDVKNIELMTENPDKIHALRDKVVKITPIFSDQQDKNKKYLDDKRKYFKQLNSY
jgi:3,4-dihydroxy 2-butanone 4-phosphate synthase/GTP cyclohydrolase II